MTKRTDKEAAALRAASARWYGGEGTLDVLSGLARTLARGNPAATRVTAQFLLDLDSVPAPDERRFRYRVIIVKTASCGCALLPNEDAPRQIPALVGTNLLSRHTFPRQLRVAAWDAVAASIRSDAPHRAEVLNGPAATQAALRARMVADEVDRCALSLGLPKACRVALIGFSHEIYRALRDRRYDVHVGELDARCDMSVVPRHRTTLGRHSGRTALRHTDVAVITGMTIANGTLDGLLRQASAARCGVVLYAETGHALLSLLPRLGIVDSVVSEPFPFYVFGAPTRAFVVRHRRNQQHAH